MIRGVPGHGGFRKGLLLFQRTVISLKLFFPGGQYFCIFEAQPPCEVARMLPVSAEWMQNAGAWLMQMLWARWKSWRNEQNRTSFLQADLHFLYNSYRDPLAVPSWSPCWFPSYIFVPERLQNEQVSWTLAISCLELTSPSSSVNYSSSEADLRHQIESF